MSFLTKLFGNYADDLAKAAAKTSAKSVGKSVLASQSDDIIKAAGKSLAKNADDSTKSALKTISGNIGSQADDMAKAGAKKLTSTLDDTAKISVKPTKATATQKIASKDRLGYASDLGATTKQREELFRNYRLGNKGTTIGDYLKNQNVTLANIKDRSDVALNAFGNVKKNLLQLADDSGITIDLPNAVNWNSTALKKSDLNMIKNTLGIDLEKDVLNRAVKPSEAEALFTELRNRAFNYQKSDATKAAGKALQNAVEELGDKIDDSLDSIKGTYNLTQKVADAASEAGLGQKEVRNIIEKGDKLSVRDLRTLQQPWVIASDMVANKAPKGATLTIAGIDTGLPNYLKKGVESAGELPLKAQAILENNPALRNAGLVGAGVVGGSILGGLLSGGQGGGNVDMTTGYGGYGGGADLSSGMTNLGTSMTGATNEPTINGYTYDDLESAYFNAMMAGDTDAAKIAGSMMDVLANKIERQKSSTDSSGIAAKQRGAINVLNNLMSNFRAKGAISGNVSQFLNMLTGGGFDPQQYAYDTGSRGSLGTIIKALGDTGALSEGDQQRALQLLPSTADSPQAAQMKYQQLLQILQSAGTQ